MMWPYRRIPKEASYLCKRLLKKTKEQFGYDLEPMMDDKFIRVQRSYAGEWQRSSGAWAWWINAIIKDDDGQKSVITIGSQWPLSEVVK